jgi:hypothetical protein
MRSSDFVMKDSGDRMSYESGMVRETQEGKPRFDLLVVEGVPYMEQPLTRFAMLLTRGANKYSARNWECAESEEELERFRASAARHFMQWMSGETDEDHMTSTWFNMMAADYVEWKLRDKLSSDQ